MSSIERAAGKANWFTRGAMDTTIVVASRWALQTDEQGTPAAILETNNDITARKRAEAELYASERRHRHIYQAIGVSIWEEDFSRVKAAIDELKAQGVQDFREYLKAHPDFVSQAIAMVTVVDVNDATVKLFGARNKEDLLVSLDKVFTPDTYDVFAGELIALAEGRTSFESETVLRTLQGDQVAVLFTIAFPPPPSAFETVLVSITDITERKRAEETLQQQANLLEQTHDAIIVWEFPGKIVYWNRGAELLYGFSREEAVGGLTHDLLQTVHPVAAPRFEAMLQRDGQWSGELGHTTRDGRTIIVDSRHLLVSTADGRRLVLETNRDITERKRAEQALEDLAGRLIRAQEEERSRIGRELHDHISQMLGVLTIQIDQLRADPTITLAIAAALDQLRQGAIEVTDDVRRLSHRLHSSMLDYLGLAPALQKLVAEFSERYSIPMQFSHADAACASAVGGCAGALSCHRGEPHQYREAQSCAVGACRDPRRLRRHSSHRRGRRQRLRRDGPGEQGWSWFCEHAGASSRASWDRSRRLRAFAGDQNRCLGAIGEPRQQRTPRCRAGRSGDREIPPSVKSGGAAMTIEMRKTGIDVVGDMPWGTHFCLFYETKDDILDTVVPYCKAGLENQEFCLWVVSEPLSKEEARHALKQAVPDLDRYLADHSIEIVSARDWYLQDGVFDLKRVTDAWHEQLTRALTRGYAGVRVTGDTAWLEKKDWKDFCEYEEGLNEAVANQRLAVLCTYPLAACGAVEVLDVVRTHQFAVTKRRRSWDVIETAGVKQAKAEIMRLNAELEQRVEERTSELTAVNEELRKEILERQRAEQALEGLAGRLIHAQEEERSRIGRELHDHISQSLSLLTLMIDELQADPAITPGIARALAEMRQGAGDVTDDVHRLSHRLHSSTLDYLGLVPAVQKLAGEFSARHGVSIDFAHGPLPASLPSEVALCLFRVTEASLANIAKHSRAGSARIHVHGTEDGIHLTVEDDGIGFEVTDLASKGGLGFVSMQERLRALRGTVRVDSAPSRGTRIDVWVPSTSLVTSASLDAEQDGVSTGKSPPSAGPA